jgi:hypothetical protein
MSRYRCNTCQGEYEDVGPDGMAYFHVCPPVTLVRVRFEDGSELEQPLRAFKGLTIAADQAAKVALMRDGVPPHTIVIELARRAARRKDARDENTLRREGDKGERRILKAEGRGRTGIVIVALPEEPVDDAP